jgi:hypothetical protein
MIVLAAFLTFVGFVLLLLAYGRYLDADFGGAVVCTSASGLFILASLVLVGDLTELFAALLTAVSILYVIFVAALIFWLRGRPPL